MYRQLLLLTICGSERQLKRKIKDWKLDKNVKLAEMKVIVAKKQQRAAIGKSTTFRVRGQPVTPAKIDRWQKRSGEVKSRAETATAPNSRKFLETISSLAQPWLIWSQQLCRRRQISVTILALTKLSRSRLSPKGHSRTKRFLTGGLYLHLNEISTPWLVGTWVLDGVPFHLLFLRLKTTT